MISLNKPKEKGFTLIEVMIALVIFSIGIIALSSMINYVMRSNIRAKEITQATTFGQRALEMVRAMDFRRDWRLSDQYPANNNALLTDPFGQTTSLAQSQLGINNADFEFKFDRKGRELSPTRTINNNYFTDKTQNKAPGNLTEEDYTLTINVANENNLPDLSTGLKKINLIISWGSQRRRTFLSTYRAIMD